MSDVSRDRLRELWSALGCAPNPDDFKLGTRIDMWRQALEMVRARTAALEASVQAPGMSREGKVLTVLHEQMNRPVAVQAPAVDREALAAAIHERFNLARGHGGVAPLALADQIFASGILLDAREVEARGLKAAEQVARPVVDEWAAKRDDSDYPESHYGQWLDGAVAGSLAVANRIALRAQQVREGNASTHDSSTTTTGEQA